MLLSQPAGGTKGALAKQHVPGWPVLLGILISPVERGLSSALPWGDSWHFFALHLLYCWCLVAKLCPTLCDPLDCSPPGSSVQGILQARILEWVAIPSSKGSSWPRDQIHISCFGRRILYHWATWAAPSLSVQFSSVAQLCPNLCDLMNRSTPGLPVHHQLPEFIQTHVHQGGDAIQPSHPLSSPSPPTFNLSQHQGLSNESVLCIRWPKYWSFSFSISPSNEYSRLIAVRMDWLNLLVVQGPLQSLLQHHSSKASILLHSAFFIVQLSHPSITTGETIALTRQTFVGKVMSLLFNVLSRLVIIFLPRCKYLLISWLQWASAVILETPR